MNLSDYLKNLPPDESEEQWATAAAAFIGSLAQSTNAEISNDVRIATLVLFARMPESLEDKAIKYIDENVDEIISRSDEFLYGKEEVDLLIEVVEQGIDPDDLL